MATLLDKMGEKEIKSSDLETHNSAEYTIINKKRLPVRID